MGSYEFTNSWFEGNKNLWDRLIAQINPRKILEIGSFEGASACYLIDKLSADAELEIHCVDTWLGSNEHQPGGQFAVDMHLVESRFNKNTFLATKNAKYRVDLNVHKRAAVETLAALMIAGKADYFDFVYVDGSHQAPDVLADAVLSFQLLKIGGYMAFDDYCWFEETGREVESLRCPKIAVDAFTNIYRQKLSFYEVTKNQLFVQKIAH